MRSVASLNDIRAGDVPHSIGMRTLEAARHALYQVEVTPVLRQYLIESAAIKSLKTAGEVELNVAVIVVSAYNAYRRRSNDQSLQAGR